MNSWGWAVICSPHKNRSSLKLKIVVFGPNPSVIAARKVNPGDVRNCRRTKRRSVIT